MEETDIMSNSNPYEYARQQRIMENKRRLQELGLDKHVARFSATGAPTVSKKTRKITEVNRQIPRRVSQRLKKNETGRPEPFAISPIESENIEIPKSLEIVTGSQEIDSSKPKVTCHWCRQKTTKGHVVCTSQHCGSQNRLRISFCEMCLRNRNGEDFEKAVACGEWICPKCRGSCGPGCVSCCNCGPCRKMLGLGPTYQMVKQARLEGFNNVHDYLIYKETGEKLEVIAARKQQFAWCR